MFDLNKEINKWLNGLGRSEAFEGRDITELQSHLRQECENLKTLGLSEQEAFLVARQRLGDTSALENEFAKVNGRHIWRNRLFWAGAGLLSYILATYIARCASTGFVLLAKFAGVKHYSLGVVDTISQIVFFLAVIFVLYEIAGRKKRQGGLLCKDAGNPWSKFLLFASVFIIIAVMLAARILVARVVGAREYGEIVLFRAFAGFVWQISMPLILLAVVICLRPSKLRKAGT